MNRRRFLHASVVTSATTLWATAAAGAAPTFNVIETRTISHASQVYHGWPTLARRKSGQLMVVCSGGREGHVCPFGRVEMMVSDDGGATWSWPRVLIDSDLDDRDAGILETGRGSLLVTSFTSLAYESQLAAAESQASGAPGAWPADRLRAWKAARDRLPPSARQARLGQWMTRSTDGGLTWSAPYPCQVNSPHGPIELADGRLLYAGKELWTGAKRTGVCESTDDGLTWRWLAEIPTRPGDDAAEYHELHAVETADARLIVHIRNDNRANPGETLQTESSDAGRTWSEPRPIGVWGLPSHLLRLPDGRLVMSYGHRRAPFGVQARVSPDHGRTWSEPLKISTDGTSVDLGYPSTAALEDGSLLTVWYELPKESDKAVLRQARWSCPARQ
jgi:sialidase-1